MKKKIKKTIKKTINYKTLSIILACVVLCLTSSVVVLGVALKNKSVQYAEAKEQYNSAVDDVYNFFVPALLFVCDASTAVKTQEQCLTAMAKMANAYNANPNPVFDFEHIKQKIKD